MHHTARRAESLRAHHEVCCVVHVEGSVFTIASNGGEREARCAVSCLVEPAIADDVVVAIVPGRGCYILAVLEREDGAARRIVVDGDLRIDVPRGRFQLALVGSVVRAEVEAVKLSATTFESIVERVTQRIKRAYRFVESEQVRAERLDYAATKTVRLHAENAVLTAEELIKIDGAQIHVG